MMKQFLPLSLFAIITYFIAGIGARQAIVNGIVAKAGQFPYYVTLHRMHEDTACGGGIIADRFVVTAAHCVFKNGQIDRQHLVVLAGTNNLGITAEPAMASHVKKIMIPKSFKLVKGAGDDIAVLMLNHTLRLSPHIKKLEIPKHKDENYAGKLALIAGFGWDKVEIEGDRINGEYSDTLMRFAEVEVLDHCIKREEKFKIPEKLICAKIVQPNMSKPRGTCRGDSGGPLVVGKTVIGVLSTGPRDCDEIDTGSIYTRVSHFLDFIHHAMDDKNHNDVITVNLL